MQNQTYEAVAIECVVRYDTKGPEIRAYQVHQNADE